MEALLIELAKQALTIGFTMAKMSGKSAEEIVQMAKETWAEVEKRNPADLPDV